MSKDKITKINFFISIYNEKNWLDKLGKSGLLLKKKGFFHYIFEKSEKTYEYDVDWLDSSPDTPENTEYINKKTENGLLYCARRSCFVYFAGETENPPVKDQAAISRMKKRFLSLSIFWGVLTAFFIALLAYNFRYMLFFNKIKYVVPADKNEIIKLFDWVVGKNPAQLFFLALIPLMAIVASYFIIYIFEYNLWSKKYKAANIPVMATQAEGEKQ